MSVFWAFSIVETMLYYSHDKENKTLKEVTTMKNSKTATNNSTTIKALLDTIPARLHTELDLSTPEKALDVLYGEGFFEDTLPFLTACGYESFSDIMEPCDSELVVKCGKKAMYPFNRLFCKYDKPTEEDIALYGDLSECAQIFYLIECGDDIEPLTDISFYEEYDEEDGYMALFNKPFCYFGQFLETCKRIAAHTKDTITIQCFNNSERPYIYTINEKGEAQLSCDTFTIVDDNGWEFACGLLMYLETFLCETYEEIDALGIKIIVEQDPDPVKLNLDNGMNYIKEHEDELSKISDIDEAKKLIQKYPNVVSYLPEKMQNNMDIVRTFISANSKYMDKYYQLRYDWNIGRHFILTGSLFRMELRFISQNGIIPASKFWVSYTRKLPDKWMDNLDIFSELATSDMRELCHLSEHMFSLADHKSLLEKNHSYAFVLLDYFEEKIKRENDDKTLPKQSTIAEKIMRKYETNDDIDTHDIALLATFDMVKSLCPVALSTLIDVYDNIILIKYIKDYLMSLSDDERNQMIGCNLRFAYAVRNELSPNDDIVDFICKQCPRAGDILSDEIVLARGLHRSDDDTLCGNCRLC